MKRGKIGLNTLKLRKQYIDERRCSGSRNMESCNLPYNRLAREKDISHYEELRHSQRGS